MLQYHTAGESHGKTLIALVDGFPAETMRMWELAVAGEWKAAREIYRWFMPLLHLDDHPKLVQYMKLVCQECGYGHERTRAPRLSLVGAERERVLGYSLTLAPTEYARTYRIRSHLLTLAPTGFPIRTDSCNNWSDLCTFLESPLTTTTAPPR